MGSIAADRELLRASVTALRSPAFQLQRSVRTTARGDDTLSAARIHVPERQRRRRSAAESAGKNRYTLSSKIQFSARTTRSSVPQRCAGGG